MCPPLSSTNSPRSHQPTVIYQWRCPLCDLSRLAGYGSNEKYRAVNDLRMHIQSTADATHGQKNAFPATYEPDTINSETLDTVPIETYVSCLR